jgi:hypothetical protein
MVLPQIGLLTRGSLLGIDKTPLLCSEAGLNSNLGSYQSDEWGSQVGSRAFLGSFVQLELTSLIHWERGSLPSDQHGPVVPDRGGPSSGWGC